MDSETGILARSASIENREKQPILLEQVAAAQWTLPPARYLLSYLTGRWAGEWTLDQEPIHAGARVIESRRGSTGHQANPWFAMSRDSSQEVVCPITAHEEYVEVWFCALASSGSWRITVEQTQLDSVRLTGGFNPFDFGYKLNPGERLETPLFYGGDSGPGLGGGSPLVHHLGLGQVLPHGPAPRPQPRLYNTWGRTALQ